MSRNYKFHNPGGLYFVTFTIINWIEVFTRIEYFDLFAECLVHCRRNKQMELYAYCIMSTHIHLILRSNNENPSGLIRDLKGFSGKQLIKAIIQNPRESRKEYLLQEFRKAAVKEGKGRKYKLWQSHNKPIELWSNSVIKQKLNYIHNNPVEAGLVMHPWEYRYSSARNYAELDYVIEIDDTGFLG